MHIHPVFYVSLLEPYNRSTISGRIRPPPPPVVVDDEPEYEVETILDSAYRRNKLYYKIQWKGYPASENSWQPASNAANAPRVILDFHTHYPPKPGPMPARPRKLKRGNHINRTTTLGFSWVSPASGHRHEILIN